MAADNAFPSPPKNALNLPGTTRSQSQVDTVPPPPAYGAIPTTVPEPDTPQPMPYGPVPIWLQQPKPRRAVCCRFWKTVFVAMFLCFIIKAGIRRVHTGLVGYSSHRRGAILMFYTVERYVVSNSRRRDNVRLYRRICVGWHSCSRLLPLLCS